MNSTSTPPTLGLRLGYAMLINEIFYSIQGEGSLSGTPSQFIRTSGCNLRCVWCDTPHTSWDSVGTSMTVDEIAEQVMDDIPHLVITGGEPLIQADLPKLISKLRRPERHITVETAGTIFTEAARPNLFSVSPKLSSSWPTLAGSGKFTTATSSKNTCPTTVTAESRSSGSLFWTPKAKCAKPLPWRRCRKNQSGWANYAWTFNAIFRPGYR